MPPGPADPIVWEPAPAKINLCLHVTGRRDDGYHTLDSLVAFGGAGDRLRVEPHPDLTLDLRGPFGHAMGLHPNNLVLRAAHAVAGRAPVPPPGARLILEKNLPLAAGVGGGSADAAAALRLLDRFWNLSLDPASLLQIAAGLGADVPVCLAAVPARMRGFGEQIDPVAIPPCYLVLANAGTPVPTAAIFALLAESKAESWSTALQPQAWSTVDDLAAWLRTTTNDLQAPAIAHTPVIGQIIVALAKTPGCLLARMSGSGGTCFGLYADPLAADRAAKAIQRPGWWIWHGRTNGLRE